MAKTILKKYIAVFLCIILLFCSVPFAASAEEGEINLTINAYASTTPDLNKAKAVSDDKALAESINTQLKNFKTYVDISNFRLENTMSNQQKIIDILSGKLPECFHIALNFSTASNGGYITYIIPTYIYTEEKYESMLAECDAVADKMLEGVEGNDNLGDVEKLLILHDRIALACEYDYERYLAGQLPQISYSMYGVFVEGLAVCQGYALAYSYLLDRIGIENYYCGSKKLNHAWNIVYVNGKPYHVDITWDDNPWDITGEVMHDNFLVSTEKLKENDHIADDYDNSPTDTTYDNYFWQDSQTAFTLLNNEIYYIDGKDGQTVAIKRYSDKEVIYTTEHRWRVSATGYYPGNYARLDTDGRDLLFSLSDGIYKLDVKTGAATEIHKSNMNYPFRIYGFTYDKGMLIYDLWDYPLFDENTKRLYEHKVPYLPYAVGDIDGSSIIDLQDVLALAQIFAGWQVNANKDMLDINGDGYENLKDLIYLARYVAGWQEIGLH